MNKRMLIDAARVDETRVVVVNSGRIEVVDQENDSQKQLKSNVYLARITRVEPSLQAAFVDYGGNRHGFLPFSEIHPDYYQIPAEDRDKLIAEAAAKLAERQAERQRNRAAARERAAHERAGQAMATAQSGQRGPLDFADDGDASDANAASGDVAHSVHGPRNEVQTAPIGVFGGIEIIDAGDQPLVNDLIPQRRQRAETNTPAPGPAQIEDDAIALADQLSAKDSEVEEGALDMADLAALDGLTRLADDAENASGDGATGDDDPDGDAVVLATDSGVSAEDIVDVDDDVDDEDATYEDDELEGRAILRNIINGRYKIQDVIKRRQVMVIQVTKEERGNKGAALSTYLSLAGRYCVLMPNTQRGGGISRKIANPRDRRKLKQILAEIQIPNDVSVIVRTAGSERSKAEIRRDYEYLMRAWDEIRENALSSQAPALVYEEGNVIKRAVRDLYSRDMDEILVEGQRGYETAKAFMRSLTPSHAKKVRQHKDNTPLFLDAGIETQLDSLHDPVVPLASGGYLVMNQTEALVAVDVNSGKATKERNIEDTALQTNLEAAMEVARQLRLRDMAGLVVIDFIDMDESRHRGMVERKLRDAMKGDRARIQLGKISGFGLLELSRQRLRPSVFETSTHTCPTCSGSGLVRTDTSFGRAILRRVEQLARDAGAAHDAVEATVPFSVGLVILNKLRGDVTAMEQRLGCRVAIIPDAHVDAPNFHVDVHCDGRVKHFDEGSAKRDVAAGSSSGASGGSGTRGDSRGDRSRGEARRGGRGRRDERERNAERPRRNDKGADRRKPQAADGDAAHSAEVAAAPVNEAAEKTDTAEPRKNGRRRGGRGRAKPEDGGGPADASDQDAKGVERAQIAVDGTAAESEDADKKGRRRGKRGGRRRGAQKDESATDQAGTNAPTSDPAAPTHQADASAVTPANGASGGDPAVVEPPAVEPVSEPPVPTPAPDASPAHQATANGGGGEADTQSVPQDTPPKDGQKKRGWFSRARDAITGSR